MNFVGPALKKTGEVDPRLISELVSTLRADFSDKWKKRSLDLMDTSYVLKAIGPTTADRLSVEDENRLVDLCKPFFMPFLQPGDEIVYLDVSCLPPGTESRVHFDYGWIHLMSRRLRIPLVTNPRAIFACRDNEKSISTYNLKVGNVYETNNMILHCAGNFGPEERWHLVADILDKRALDFLAHHDIISKAAVHKSCNDFFNEGFAQQMHEALQGKPNSEI